MSKSPLIVGAAIVLFGAASFAGDNGMLRGEAWDGSHEPIARAGAYGRAFDEPGLSREAVMAEAARAQRAGEISSGEAWDGTFQSSSRSGAYGRPFANSGLSRDEVKAELKQARESGAFDRHHGNYVGGD